MGMQDQDPAETPYSIRPPKPRFPHPVRLLAAALSRDGTILVALDEEGVLNGWDARTARRLYRRPLLAKNDVARRLTCSPDGRYVALSGRYFPPADVRVLILETGQPVRSFDRGFSPVFSPDGEILAAADGPVLRRWALKSGAQLPTLYEGTFDLKWVAYSTQGDRIAACLENSGEVLVWDAATRRAVAPHAGVRGHVTGLTFSPDGKTLAIGTWTGVRFWNLAEDEELDGHSHEECTRGLLRYSPDGRRMIAQIAQRRILVWNLVSGRYLHAWGAHLLPDGLVEVSEGGDVAVWIEKGGMRLERIPEPLGGKDSGHLIRTIGFSADGLVITGDDRGTVRFWDPASQKEVRKVEVPQGTIRGFSADGKWVIFGGEDQSVSVWDLLTAKEILRADAKPTINVVALSPDRRTLALGHTDGFLSLWDTATSGERCRVRPDTGGVTAIAWSPDGKSVAWGDVAGAVVIAEGSRGRDPLVFKPRGRKSIVDIVFAPDGKSLTALDQGGARRLYRDQAGFEPELTSVNPIERRLDDRWSASGYVQNNYGFGSRVFSPDGTFVVTLVDGTAMIWQAPGAK